MLVDHGDLNSKNLFFDKLSPSKSRYSFEGHYIDHIEVSTYSSNHMKLIKNR